MKLTNERLAEIEAFVPPGFSSRVERCNIVELLAEVRRLQAVVGLLERCPCCGEEHELCRCDDAAPLRAAEARVAELEDFERKVGYADERLKEAIEWYSKFPGEGSFSRIQQAFEILHKAYHRKRVGGAE